MQALTAGWDESQPTNARATALFTAAVIARTNGMELLGTEVGPDWHVHEGDFEFELTAERRASKELGSLRATPEELRRAFTHKADPERRFHYRYHAASLAWEAAKLMPDNTDETARVLCIAGSWLKKRDPETADFYFLALVRRCRKTAIGDQADRMRWFPVLDADRNPKPWAPKLEKSEVAPVEADTASPEMQSLAPVPPRVGDGDSARGDDAGLLGQVSEQGYEYTVRAGETLPLIVKTCRETGIPVTVSELGTANPGLHAGRLQVGQKIFIPAVRPAPPAKPPE